MVFDVSRPVVYQGNLVWARATSRKLVNLHLPSGHSFWVMLSDVGGLIAEDNVSKEFQAAIAGPKYPSPPVSGL